MTDTAPAIEYYDARGVRHVGYVEDVITGFDDTTYRMRDTETGEVSMIGGPGVRMRATGGVAIRWEAINGR